jgi:hypothetical protein
MASYDPYPGDDRMPVDVVGPPVTKRGVLPTAKLVSAAVTMVLLYVLRQFVDVDRELEDIINLVVPLIVAYRVPNSDTPGGVPDARPVLSDEPDVKPDSWRPR